MLNKIPDDVWKDMLKSMSKKASKNLEWLTYLFKNHWIQNYKSAQKKWIANTTSTVKTSVTNRFKDKKFVKRLIITVLIVGTTSAGVIEYSIWAGDMAKKAQNDKTLKKTLKDADILTNTGKKESAEKAYTEAIKLVKDPKQKINLILEKASLYSNDNKYNEALSIAKDAESIELNVAVASYMADIYARRGDKPKAIEYYNKTISLIRKNKATNPLAESDIVYYQSKLDKLNSVNGG